MPAPNEQFAALIDRPDGRTALAALAASPLAAQGRDRIEIPRGGWLPGGLEHDTNRGLANHPISRIGFAKYEEISCGAYFPIGLSNSKQHSRGADSARVVQELLPSKRKRAQGKPGARCTRSLACEI